MNSSYRKIFRNSRKTWRETWIIGIALILLKHVFQHNLFYLYYYFFGIGLISLFYSFQKYAIVTDNGLTLYFGIFFKRKSIRLEWGDILNVAYSRYKKSFIGTVGGRVRIPIKETIELRGLLLKLKKPLPKKDQSDLTNGIKDNFIMKEVKIRENGSELLLLNPPEGGMKNLVSSVGKYVSASYEFPENILFSSITTYISIFNFVIFLAAILLGLTI